MSLYPYPVPEGVVIDFDYSPRPDRQDACWFMATDALATVRYAGLTINVDRNGAFRMIADGQMVKDTDGLESVGIMNDNDLWDRDDELEWEMNPWFDSYLVKDGDVVHLDLVEYSAFDAIRAAVDWVVSDDAAEFRAQSS